MTIYKDLTETLAWLAANKDGLHAAVEIIGLLGLLGSAYAFFTHYWRMRRDEIMKRALDMQREVFLELIGCMAEQFVEVGRSAAPAHVYTPVTALAGALAKVQVLASQETVHKILKLSTAVNEGIARVVLLKNEALKADNNVNLAFQQVRTQSDVFARAETVLLSRSATMPLNPAHVAEADRANDALRNACEAHERARLAGIAVWTSFFEAMRDFLDGIADDLQAAYCAARKELSVETDEAAYSEMLRTHRQSARKVVLAMFETIRRNHLALPRESYEQQPVEALVSASARRPPASITS